MHLYNSPLSPASLKASPAFNLEERRTKILKFTWVLWFGILQSKAEVGHPDPELLCRNGATLAGL